jgi:hypothetical protein
MVSITPESLEIAFQALCSGDLAPVRLSLQWMQRSDAICGLFGRLLHRGEFFTREEIEEGRKLLDQLLRELEQISKQEGQERAKRLARMARRWAKLVTQVVPGIAGRPPSTHEELRSEVLQLEEKGCSRRKAVKQVARKHSVSERTVWRALAAAAGISTVIIDSGTTEPEAEQAVWRNQTARPSNLPGPSDSALQSKPRTTRG